MRRGKYPGKPYAQTWAIVWTQQAATIITYCRSGLNSFTEIKFYLKLDLCLLS